MGDWRHFGERLEYAPSAPGCGSVGDAVPAFRGTPRPWAAPKRTLHALPDALARVVEAEILPRLMLAYRPAAGRRPSVERTLTPQEIAAFSALLLAPGPVDLDARRSTPCWMAACRWRGCSSICSPRRPGISGPCGRRMPAISWP